MAAVEEKTGLALVLQNLMVYRTVKVRGLRRLQKGACTARREVGLPWRSTDSA